MPTIEEYKKRAKSHRIKLPGAEAPIIFNIPVWKCKVCKWKFNNQVRWDRCPNCDTLFSLVRIQTDRGHQVVSTGPYRWIRHPGYAGALLTYLATPLFLDSRWAFIPALYLAIVMVIRTSLEDRALQNELDGYRDYAGQVRYRLLPGVW